MLTGLVQASLRYRVVVVAAAGILLAAGVVDALRSPLDVFPEFAQPVNRPEQEEKKENAA